MCRRWASSIFAFVLFALLASAPIRACAATWEHQGATLTPVFDDQASANYNQGSRGEGDLADQNQRDGDRLNESADNKRDLTETIGTDRTSLLNQLASVGSGASNPAEEEAARQEVLSRPYEASKHGEKLKEMLPTNKELFDKGPQKQDALKAEAEKESKKGNELVSKAKQQRENAAEMKKKGEVAAARREGLNTAGHKGGIVKPKETPSEIKVSEKSGKAASSASKSTQGLDRPVNTKFPSGDKARGLAGISAAASGGAAENAATKAKEEEVLNHANGKEMVSKDFEKEKESDKEKKWALLDGIVGSKEPGSGTGTTASTGSGIGGKAQDQSESRWNDRQIVDDWRAELEEGGRSPASVMDLSIFYRMHRCLVVQQERGNVSKVP